MPHITVRGIAKEALKAMALDLKKVVVEASLMEQEYVKVFFSPIERMDAVDEVAVDVYWMHRPQDMCDRVAEALTKYLKEKGYSFVQVTFTEFPGNLFYEDNVHY